MKKALLVALTIVMVFALVACADEPKNNGTVSAEQQGKKNLVAQGSSSRSKMVVVPDEITKSGFDIEGSYKAPGSDTEVHVNVGGYEGIYWLGIDENNNGSFETGEYKYFQDLGSSGVKYYLSADNRGTYNDSSILKQLFADGGAVDQVLYNSSFEVSKLNISGVDLSNLVEVGEMNGIVTYESEITIDGVGKVGTLQIKRSDLFAFTVYYKIDLDSPYDEALKDKLSNSFSAKFDFTLDREYAQYLAAVEALEVR